MEARSEAHPRWRVHDADWCRGTSSLASQL